MPKQPKTVNGSYCKFFFKDRHMEGISCGVKVDETGRTTAIVAFDAAPG